MKLLYNQTDIPNPLEVLRKAGYSHFVDPKTNEESYVLRLTADFYPRFHLYLEKQDDFWSFNLHLDQKKASYQGSSAHAGEYDGPTIEKEIKRLRDWIFSLTGAKPQMNPTKIPPEGHGFRYPTPEEFAEMYGPAQQASEDKESIDEKSANNDPPQLFGGIF